MKRHVGRVLHGTDFKTGGRLPPEVFQCKFDHVAEQYIAQA